MVVALSWLMEPRNKVAARQHGGGGSLQPCREVTLQLPAAGVRRFGGATGSLGEWDAGWLASRVEPTDQE
jgi:hypothetical protein